MGDNQVQNLILFPMIVGWATGPSDVENRAAWWGCKGGAEVAVECSSQVVKLSYRND